MSYYSYGAAGPIDFSTFDTWANNVTSATNIELDVALSDYYPAQSAPYQASVLLGADVFYGSVVAGTGGTVSMSYPYTVSATTSFTIKNMDLGAYNPSLTATATYPYTFDSWRTAAGGGGTQIATTAGLIINTSTTQATTYYAYFTTTHISP